MVTRRFILTVLTAALVAIAGCSASFSLFKPEPKPVPQQVVGHPLSAQNIPRDAQLVAQGVSDLKFTADAPGTLFVFSRDDRQLYLQGEYQPGESFGLSTTGSGASFTAQRATSTGSGSLPLSKSGYELYFQRKGTPTTTTVPAATTAPTTGPSSAPLAP